MSSNDEVIKNEVSNILKIDPMDHIKIYNQFEKLKKILCIGPLIFLYPYSFFILNKIK